MSDIEFVFFDLGKVLVDFSHDLACQQMAKVSKVPAEKIKEIVFSSELQMQYEKGAITTKKFFEAFCKETGTNPNRRELIEAASDIFTLNAGVIPLVSALASSSFPRGILSNTCSAHWELIERRFSTLLELLPIHALSFEMHEIKPELEIYKKAEQLVGVSPERILFVDDRLENVEGARAAGWQAEHYEHPFQLSQVFRDKGFLV